MRGSTTIGKRLLLVGFKWAVMPVRILKTYAGNPAGTNKDTYVGINSLAAST